MKKPLDAETVKQVHDAWMKHLVVVFPDQQITDQEHVAFTRNFGEAEIFHQTSLQPALGPGARDLPGVQRRRAEQAPEAQRPGPEAALLVAAVAHRFELPAGALHGLAAARHRDQPHRRHHPVHQHVHGLRRAAGKPEAPGRGPQGAARFQHAEPAGRLAAADRQGEGRHAAGVASHGAQASRDRPQVPLHQLDLQRCRRGPGRGTGAPADRGAVGVRRPAASTCTATNGSRTTC